MEMFDKKLCLCTVSFDLGKQPFKLDINFLTPVEMQIKTNTENIQL